MRNHSLEKQEVLYRLHRYNEWSEDLLSETLFGTGFHRIFTPREFFVLEELIMGKSDEEILKELNTNSPQGRVRMSTLERMKRQIKQKFRLGPTSRQLPGWLRSNSSQSWSNM